MKDNRHDPIRTMAATLWGEARGESREGKIAVAWVIMNRAANPGWWGTDIISVCTSPWQFSCWFDGQADRVAHVDERDVKFVQCLGVASGVLHDVWIDPTYGADHYYAPLAMVPVSRVPKWAIGKKATAKIGGHIFYRLGLDGTG